MRPGHCTAPRLPKGSTPTPTRLPFKAAIPGKFTPQTGANRSFSKHFLAENRNCQKKINLKVIYRMLRTYTDLDRNSIRTIENRKARKAILAPKKFRVLLRMIVSRARIKVESHTRGKGYAHFIWTIVSYYFDDKNVLTIISKNKKVRMRRIKYWDHAMYTCSILLFYSDSNVSGENIHFLHTFFNIKRHLPSIWPTLGARFYAKVHKAHIGNGNLLHDTRVKTARGLDINS